MNVPMTWLSDFVDISGIEMRRFTDVMTAAGTKVEGVHTVGALLRNIVVGKVVSARPHPGSGKLRVCQVDVGAGQLLSIVAGAANVMPGDYVPVALDGACIADGKEIRTGDIRGEASQGMMCSVEELGFTRFDYPESPENGIYVFEAQHPLGADAIEILKMRADVVEYEITSNRTDCFSVVGIAREAAAAFEREFTLPKPALREEGGADASAEISVEIHNQEGCPRYVARVVTDVKIGPSPLWLRNRLTMAGLRPINNIVDITNYVNLELGQPLHAFDIDCVAQRRIIVRSAADGEQFVTLDGAERVLDASMLVIADPEKALAIAGIMGGENSKIGDGAQTVLFESACFDGPMIRAASAKLGMRTEASSKFEKGLDPNLTLAAIERAAELVEKLGCGKVLRGAVDVYPNVRVEKTVSYDAGRVSGIINAEFTHAQIEAYLARLGITAKDGAARIPTFRQDISIEADIAEEVARLFGYDNIPTARGTGAPTSIMAGKKTAKQVCEDDIRHKLVSFGLYEALTFSFESPRVFDSLRIPEGDALRNAIKIRNPLGEEYSIMRTQTIGGMLRSLSLNYNRRNPRAWLFELGKLYTPRTDGGGLAVETEVLTIGMYGGGADFFAAKGIAEAIINTVTDTDIDTAADSGLCFLHPGRAARLWVNSGADQAGIVGEVHPDVAAAYDIGERVYVAALNLSKLFDMPRPVKAYRPLPKFPGISRDIAVVLADTVEVAQMRRVIVAAAGQYLEGAELFDVYTGEQVGKGFVSAAFRLDFRAKERTMVDAEVDAAVSAVVESLGGTFGAKLR
ncbi:MAG: phenylalanine--tRNA ligase subunit beta [Defluviitaleaceae bacterium]|nr:phenylalanine--tRNA ligase subunit beta [Defluviitaleaceae bacterium]